MQLGAESLVGMQGGARMESFGKRCSEGDGLPILLRQKVLAGFNDMKTKQPELAGEWDFAKNGRLTPENVTQACGKKVWWRCKKGHSWQKEIYNRTYGSGCPYCSGHLVVKGETDLKTVNAGLAGEWDYDKNGDIRPENFLPQSGCKVWWKCQKGHSWKAVIESRTTRGTGCPYCIGRIKMRTRFIN